MNKVSIGFFYPTRGVGGAQYLFARMAEYLIEHTTFEVVLIDYPDGFIRSQLKTKVYRFIEYTDWVPVLIKEPILLVLSLSYAPIVQQHFILPAMTRLFFWDLHPYNLVEQFALSGVYKWLKPNTAHSICSLIEHHRYRKLASFVDCGAVSHGIVFMAERNKIYNQQLLRFTANVGYLPLPIDTTTNPLMSASTRCISTDSVINIGWFSRLDAWKSAVLYRLIEDIEMYEAQHGRGRICIHIIGDGQERNSIAKRCVGINVQMAGRLEGDHLTKYMITNLDIGFAMGTSALELAVRCIPTVLTSGGMGQDDLRRADKYRWLFDSQGYDVTSEEVFRNVGLYTFADILQCLYENNIRQLGERCRNYVVAKHDISIVGSMFVDYLSKCVLTYGDLQQISLYRYSSTERILFALKKMFKRCKMLHLHRNRSYAVEKAKV